MKWYESILEHLDDKKTYSNKELVEALKKIRPGLSENTYHWTVNALIRDCLLSKLGYDSYCLYVSEPKQKYVPIYSDRAKELITLISNKYKELCFTVFETTLLNEFLNHLISQNTIFIQVEKDSSIFVFRFLQDMGYMKIMYKPQLKDFNLYWSKDSIVITDLISESPIRSENSHSILLEKMLVDIVSDKLIESTFSKAEIPEVAEQMRKKYQFDDSRMMRYARRRNREKLSSEFV